MNVIRKHGQDDYIRVLFNSEAKSRIKELAAVKGMKYQTMIKARLGYRLF